MAKLSPFESLGRFLGIIGQIPSVSKSNQFHVVIFWVLFINLRNTL